MANGFVSCDIVMLTNAKTKINLIINTPLGRESFFDEKAIRRSAMQHGTPCITTLSAATAAARAIKALQHEELKVKSLQEYHSPEELS